MSGILFVRGDDDHAREVFDGQGRAYWSAALPVVLEKHGFLAVQAAGPEILADERALANADVVLVGTLPGAAWGAQSVEALMGTDTPVLLEGPASTAVAKQLGITAIGELEGDGAIVASDPALHAAAAAHGAAPGAPLSDEHVTPIERDPALDWTAIDRVPIEERQAAAWRRRGWDVEEWSLDSRSALLCEWVARSAPHARHPAIVRYGHIAACCFGLFGFLAQRHSIHPFEAAQWLSVDRTLGLEVILLALLDDMHRRKGAVRLRVKPWPSGRRWARTVRHDVLSPAMAELASKLDSWHGKLGSKATVYWAPSVEQPAIARRLADSDVLEVALCAERLWAEPRGIEREAVERQCGHGVTGACARGSSHCFRHQGAPNVLWAEDEGLDYTELAGRSHAHPHRFPTLSADGTVRVLDVLCLPAPESLPYLSKDDRRRTSTIDWWITAGGLCQLTAPLDAVDDRLGAALGAMPMTSRWDVTTREAADWWRRSHSGLAVEALGDGWFELRSTSPVDDLSIEILQPDGRQSEEAISVGDQPVRVHFAAAERPALVGWDETRVLFRRALRGAYGEREGAPDSPVVEAQVHATAAARQRGELFLGAMEELGGRDSLTGARVLDAGCGYGGLSLYLAWRANPAFVVGIDTSRANLDVARVVATDAGLGESALFAEGDLTSLPLDDASVDVALAVGVLMYMTSARELRQAVRELRRVLAPGGLLYVYQATRWQWRDPMSGRPLMHLFPRPVSRFVDRQPPSASKRWLSPMETAVQLRLAGFSDLRLESFGPDGARREGAERLRDPYYALWARLPSRAIRATTVDGQAPSSLASGPWMRRQQPSEWDKLEGSIERALGTYLERNESAFGDALSRRVAFRSETQLVPARAWVISTCLEDLLGLRSLRHKRVVEASSRFGGLAAYLAASEEPDEVIALASPPVAASAQEALARSGLNANVRVVPDTRAGRASIPDSTVDLVLWAGPGIPAGPGLERTIAEARRMLRPDGALLIYHPLRAVASAAAFDGSPAREEAESSADQPVLALDEAALRRTLRKQGFVSLKQRRFTDEPHKLTPARRGATFVAMAARRPSQS